MATTAQSARAMPDHHPTRGRAAGAIRTWVRDRLFTTVKRGTAPGEIRRYLAGESHPRLNIGCGGNRLSGWLNVDRFPPPGATFLDATKPLPFASGTFEAVLCEHMIEHISKAHAQQLLGEIRRSLAPNGRVRVITPDLDWLSRRIVDPAPFGLVDDAYRDFLADRKGLDEVSWCDAVNMCFYEHSHRYIWSREELAGAMRRAGFTHLAVTRAGEPKDSMFAGAEGHPRLIGALINSLEAFAIEGRA